jgi:hypothetical protein
MTTNAELYAPYSEDLLVLFAVANSLEGQLDGAAEAAEESRRVAINDSKLLRARADAANQRADAALGAAVASDQRAQAALGSAGDALSPSDITCLEELTSRSPAPATDAASIAERSAEDAVQAAKLVQESAAALGAEEGRLKHDHQDRRDMTAMTAAAALALPIPFAAGIATGSVLAVAIAVAAGIAAGCVLAYSGTSYPARIVARATDTGLSPGNELSADLRDKAARLLCGRGVAAAATAALIGLIAVSAFEAAFCAAVAGYVGVRKSRKNQRKLSGQK